MPELVTLLVRHRSPALRGRRLGEVLCNPYVRPDALLRCFRAWGPDPDRLANVRPTYAFALIGQARAAEGDRRHRRPGRRRPHAAFFDTVTAVVPERHPTDPAWRDRRLRPTHRRRVRRPYVLS